MQTYAVTFTLGGKRYTQTIGAGSSGEARRFVQSQNPKAVVWDVKPLKSAR